MNDILTEIKHQVLYITLNRVEKHNAFDDSFLLELQTILNQAERDSDIRILVLQANGPHFCAGADLNWMKRMVHMTEDQNHKDAQILARLMLTLYRSKKPTISIVQGAAYGGGAGLVAATDIVLASDKAKFCFSEVKLGLIPAVISPYVIRAIGPRNAAWLFMSAEIFTAEKALELQLVHHVFPQKTFKDNTQAFIEQISELPSEALLLCKSLVKHIENRPIDESLGVITSKLIAERRVSQEGQTHIHAFLNKS